MIDHPISDVVGSTNRLERIPSLDGLRGVAILLVIWHHCTDWVKLPAVSVMDKFWQTSAGWGHAGVQLFFILSGFLITRILVTSVHKKTYFPDFFKKRALRILPLYALYLLLIFHVFPLLCQIPDFALYSGHELWYWLFMDNFWLVITQPPASQFFVHPWSLAVEEQFYLVWPFLIKFVPERFWLTLALACALGGLFCRFSSSALSRNGWLPFCAMDTLAIGALMAILYVRNSSLITARIGYCALTSGLIGQVLITHLGMSGFFRGNAFVTVWCSILINLVSTGGLLLCLCRTSNVAQMVFASKLLSMFGKYSYCIYLVHFPLLFFEHRLISVFPDVPSWVQWMLWFMAISGESLLIGWISFVTFERRFLEKKSQINLRSEAAAN